MKKIAVLLAFAVVIAANAWVGQAHAGGDVKLNMGGPLGTFTARGKGNYVGSKRLKSHGGSSKSSGSSYAKKKAYSKKQKALSAKKREAARRNAVASKKAEEKRRIAAKRRAEARRLAAKRKKAASTVVSTEASTSDDDEAVSKSRPVKASAIAGADGLLDEDTDAKDNDALDSDEAAQADEDSDPVDVAVVKTDDKVADELGNEEPVGSGECKKYIPSAGLTISVPCEE